MKKVVEMINSELYNNDNDFETDEEKDEYYFGEFWQDEDFIKLTDEEKCDDDEIFHCQCIDDEIFVYNEDYLPKGVEEMLERFYNSDWKQHFTPLWVGNNINYKDDKNYNPNLPKMWYRGGSGYGHCCHQYNYEIQKEE